MRRGELSIANFRLPIEEGNGKIQNRPPSVSLFNRQLAIGNRQL